MRQKGRCFRCDFKFRNLEQLFRYINGGFVKPLERVLLRREPPLVVESVKKTVKSLPPAGGCDDSSRGNSNYSVFADTL